MTGPATIRRRETAAGGNEDSRLVVYWIFPEVRGRATVLDKPRLVLGRDQTCDVVLPGEQTSRQHIELRRTGAVYFARDLGSTNGLLLNGAQVTEAAIKPHDVLRVGDWIGIVTTAGSDSSIADPLFREIIPGYWGGPRLFSRLDPVRRAALSDLPIVIQGETGSGKEGVARSVHTWSARKGPFLAVNCAALPESLAEGELFGYRKGAFTGAERANPGYLRAANGGTLFLDEIVDLPLTLQAKLLRALEQREVIPLGESSPVSVDVRIVSAVQGPLSDAVAEQRFRPDLFARLDGLTVEVPPLRERKEDLVFLLGRLLAHHAQGKSTPALDPSLAERLCLHDWPFNVRELDLLARQVIALYANVPVLKRMHLPSRLRNRSSQPVMPLASATKRPRGEGPDIETFVAALRGNQGNVRRAAAALGISRAKAYRLMEAATDRDLIERQEPGDE